MVDRTRWSRDEFAYLEPDVIEEWRDAESPDPAKIVQYRAYVDGHHDDTLTPQQRKLLDKKIDHETADNVVRLIVRAAASRLTLEGFEVADEVDAEGNTVESDAVKTLRGWLDRFWLVNQWERLQYENTYAALRDGNSVLSLYWRTRGDGGDVRVSRETWWDGKAGVFIACDAEGDAVWAVKEFQDRDPDNLKKMLDRRTIYYPDRIARYVERGDGWQEYERPEQPAIVPWVKRDGSPLGIPMIHFPNGASVTDSWYGQSDLVGMLGFQDDLNTIQHDISAAAMFTGFQQVWGTGISDPRKIRVTPGGFVSSEKETARFGVLPPGDMSQLTDSHAYKRQTMAINSATPVHGIETHNLQNVAGVTLLRAEMPFIDKIEQLQSVFGPRYVMMAHRATEIANARGGAGLDEEIPLAAIFANAMRVDEETELTLSQMKADLWQSLASMPYTAMMKTGLVTEDEAKKIIEERDASQLQVERAINAGRINPAFDDDEEETA